jgi:hypothetical protein
MIAIGDDATPDGKPAVRSGGLMGNDQSGDEAGPEQGSRGTQVSHVLSLVASKLTRHSRARHAWTAVLSRKPLENAWDILRVIRIGFPGAPRYRTLFSE